MLARFFTFLRRLSEAASFYTHTLSHRRNLIVLSLICGVSVFVLGCAALSAPPLPTPLPTEYLPTVIALTVEAMGIETILDEAAPTAPAIPTDTPTPQIEAAPMASPTLRAITPTLGITLPPSTPAPTFTATPPPNIPYGAVQIISPGPASRVVSPFQLRGYFVTGPKGLVRIELLGEDGRLLMREVRVYNTPPRVQVSATFEIAFEIPGVAESGRLQISVEDEVGRTMALASQDVLLLSLGEADINPSGDLLETIVIEQPKSNALIQGGAVRVSGLARPRSDKPLMIELQTATGAVVGSRQVTVTPSANGSHGIFAIDVPYTVTAPTRVRLLVWERGERIPGIVHLSSVEVLLSP